MKSINLLFFLAIVIALVTACSFAENEIRLSYHCEGETVSHTISDRIYSSGSSGLFTSTKRILDVHNGVGHYRFKCEESQTNPGTYSFRVCYEDRGCNYIGVAIDGLSDISEMPGTYHYSSSIVTYYYNGPGVFLNYYEPENEISRDVIITFEFNVDPKILSYP